MGRIKRFPRFHPAQDRQKFRRGNIGNRAVAKPRKNIEFELSCDFFRVRRRLYRSLFVKPFPGDNFKTIGLIVGPCRFHGLPVTRRPQHVVVYEGVAIFYPDCQLKFFSFSCNNNRLWPCIIVTYMLPYVMIKVLQYLEKNGNNPFGEWFEDLDPAAAAKVTVAMARIEQGNLSNVKPIGEGVLEYKIDFGPGYRIYFGREGNELVILVAGGTKKRQSKDIEIAKARWADYKQRRR